MIDVRKAVEEAGPCGREELLEFARLCRDNHAVGAAMRSILGTCYEWTEELSNLDPDMDNYDRYSRNLGSKIRGLKQGLEGLFLAMEQAQEPKTRSEEEENNPSESEVIADLLEP